MLRYAMIQCKFRKPIKISCLKLTGRIQVVVVEDGEQDEASEGVRPESAPPPLSPQVRMNITFFQHRYKHHHAII